jgi:hypothetical protein
MTGPEMGLLIALLWAWWVIWWPGTTGGGLFLAMEEGRPEFPASSMWRSGWRGQMALHRRQTIMVERTDSGRAHHDGL